MVRLRLTIGPERLAETAKFADRRLRRHGRLKVQLLLRGAERPEVATAFPRRFAEMIDGVPVVESISLPERRQMEMVLVPSTGS
jgi:translation initiation factor IF-3